MDKAMRIYSPDSMTAAIRYFGIIPFFRGKIPGWSIEELTDPDCWFTSSEELGPWDWKIEAVREGNIAYGKFIRNKAAFATVEWYAHLMNWRRSLPQYRIPLGEHYDGNNQMDRLYKALSPTLLSAINEFGSVETTDMRQLLQERANQEELKSIGGSMNKYLFPKIKRTAVDFLNLYLEMGTWSIIGDFRRIYKGPNMEYHGWQRSSHTTPDLLFGGQNESPQDDVPYWARIIESGCQSESTPLSVECSPADSLEFLVKHVSDIMNFDNLEVIRKALK